MVLPLPFPLPFSALYSITAGRSLPTPNQHPPSKNQSHLARNGLRHRRSLRRAERRLSDEKLVQHAPEGPKVAGEAHGRLSDGKKLGRHVRRVSAFHHRHLPRRQSLAVSISLLLVLLLLVITAPLNPSTAAPSPLIQAFTSRPLLLLPILLRGHAAGAPEAAELEDAVLVDEDVGGPQVPVEVAAGVGLLQPGE